MALSVKDRFSYGDLCKSCKNKPCCTDFASPLVFSNDFVKLKKIGKSGRKFLKEVTINGAVVKTIKKKKNSTACIFWDEQKGCSIYKDRPYDCRLFPFDIYLIEGEYRWIVYSCNPQSNWKWSEPYLEKLEEDPSFDDIIKNIGAFSDVSAVKKYGPSEVSGFTILRKIKWDKRKKAPSTSVAIVQ